MAELMEDTAAARRRRKVIALTLAGLAVILLVVTILWLRSLPNDDDIVIAEPPGTIIMTGAELMAAYESDPAMAGFSREPVLVSAPLATAPNSGTTVLLRTADPLLSIGADIVATDAVRLAGAEAGDEITLLCEGIAPGLRAPTLNGCSLAVAP